MADTIVNTPGGNHDGDEGMGVGMIFGIILASLIVIVLFYMYGWPAIRGEQPQQPGTVNIYNPPASNPPPGTSTTTTTY